MGKSNSLRREDPPGGGDKDKAPDGNRGAEQGQGTELLRSSNNNSGKVSRSQDFPQSLQDAALHYADLGWPILPVHGIREDGQCTCGDPDCSSSGKHPRIRDWPNKATTDKDQIAKWWAKWPDSNIGVVTGQRSRLAVLDIDPRNRGDKSLAKLIETNGPLPSTVESQTGGGGTHKFYRYPDHPTKSKAQALGPGLDVKADGGFIVAPPSMHFSGRCYHWKEEHGPDDIPVASLPQGIADLLGEDLRVDEEMVVDDESSSFTIPEGERNDRLFRMGISMWKRGVCEQVIQETLLKINQLQTTSPLPEEEVMAIVASIVKYPAFSATQMAIHTSGKADPPAHMEEETPSLFNDQILPQETVYLVEGENTCKALVALGFPAVATQDLSDFGPGAAKRLSECTRVYLCFDGSVAAETVIRIGDFFGLKARIVQLPPDEPMEEYVRVHPTEDFENLVSEARDPITFEIEQIPEDADKLQLYGRLDPVLEKLAGLSDAEAEVFLSYRIKKRFKVNTHFIDGLRRRVKSLRGTSIADTVGRTCNSEEDVSYIAAFSGLVDLAEHNGRVVYLVKENGQVSIQTQVEIDGQTFYPPPKDKLRWLLPRGERVLEILEQTRELPQDEVAGELYDDLVEYHRSISILPGDEYYHLIALWDFHTYLLENAMYSPIICLFAVPVRGKSRTGRGMAFVAYRGIVLESLREAHLIRLAQDAHCTIFFDVMDFSRKAFAEKSMDIVLQRFERGARVPRVLFPERGPFKDTVYYSVFGATVIGTNRALHDILGSRAIYVVMPEASTRFENDVSKLDALELRERLTAFRARTLGEDLPDALKPADGRLGDILKPLRQTLLLVKPEREEAFLRFVRGLQRDQMLEKRGTIEADVLEIVASLRCKVEGGMLPIGEIVRDYNLGRHDKFQIGAKRAGWILRALGFEKGRMSTGHMAIIWDARKLERLLISHGVIGSSGTSVTSTDEELDIGDIEDSEDTEDGLGP